MENAEKSEREIARNLRRDVGNKLAETSLTTTTRFFILFHSLP